ncbi:MAG: glycerol kinase GlpK [Bdellovibrionales bacterium]|nr:glycerol kinase GlpK [Bdellovibrionales bacterium]
METILAIDEGTTGCTALIVDKNLTVIAESSVDFPQHFPKPGWVEHDVDEIWNATLQAVQNVVRKVDPKKIVAIGITNQRETVCFWDRKTTKPFSKAIVWQDRRTADFCQELKSQGLEEKFQKKTGLLLDPYFSGTKVAWALKNWKEVQAAQKAGTLAVGTIDSFLVARLTAGAEHVTEPSNASRTLAFDIHQKEFSEELCGHLGILKSIWPEVRPSVGLFGKTKNVPGLPDGIPISGILGDQQSALLGQACIREGLAKCTYGTGAFLLMNTGAKAVPSRHRLLTTIAWQLQNGETTYALEGSAFVAGAAVQWIRDGLKMIRKSEEIEVLAESVPDSDGVTFVPALTGLGAPHWDPQATGLLTGVTRGTTSAHIARAVLDGIAFQNVDILRAMEKDLGSKLKQLNVDGGASANNLLMQIQSDYLGVKLVRPKMIETTSLGAVFAAGMGVGIWKNLDEIQSSWKEDRSFEPKMADPEKQKALGRWQKAVQRTMLGH